MSSSIPDSEILVGIAALGLTVTGFSGLISVLGRRSSGQWTEIEQFQLGELIIVSLAVTFASFIPILVSMIQTGIPALSTATFLVALFHLLVLIRGASMNFRNSASAEKMSNALVSFMLLGGLALIVCAFLSCFGVIAGTAFFLVSNLLWQLMVAIIHFVILLMNSGTVEDA